MRGERVSSIGKSRIIRRRIDRRLAARERRENDKNTHRHIYTHIHPAHTHTHTHT